MCLFNSFKLSLIAISPIILFFVKMLDMSSPREYSASSLASLFNKTFISWSYWSMASGFFLENLNIFGCENWLGVDSTFMRHSLIISKISELLIIVHQLPSNDFKFPPNF